MANLTEIRKFILNGNYQFRLHVYEKLEEINNRNETNFTTDDVLSVIMEGELVDVLDNDERGRRYVISHFANNETLLEIVCRIENNLVIITVYEKYF
jgi:uncharacterized hydantoinase/oxoprolinase family protein